MTCATCRYWVRSEAPGDPRVEMRQEPLIVKSAHRKCLRIIHGNKYDADEETAAKEPALMTDGSGYAATFWTLPEFGCSLWQT